MTSILPLRFGPNSASATGAYGELLVALDLSKRGFHVYRALSPDAPCDLLVAAPDRVLRVEVTKGGRNRPGGPLHERTAHDPRRYDVLALWAEDGAIQYRPPFPGDPLPPPKPSRISPPPAPCAIADCGRPTRNRGWCNRHYLRWRRYGDPAHATPGELSDKRAPAPVVIRREFCACGCGVRLEQRGRGRPRQFAAAECRKQSPPEEGL